MIRNFKNGCPLLTLSSSITSGSTVLTVSSTAGFPTAPFTLALERGTVNEEVVLCTSLSGTQFTVTRGYDSTTARAHSSGTAVEHATAAVDYNEANTHVNSTGDVHPQYVLKTATKGSIPVGNGSTMTTQGVGANGLPLVADSAQATGVRYGTLGAGGITDASLTEAKMADAVKQTLIQVLAGAPSSANGRIYFDTGLNRWRGYQGSWLNMAYGVGKITTSTSAPPGSGQLGDIWLRYNA